MVQASVELACSGLRPPPKLGSVGRSAARRSARYVWRAGGGLDRPRCAGCRGSGLNPSRRRAHAQGSSNGMWLPDVAPAFTGAWRRGGRGGSSARDCRHARGTCDGLEGAGPPETRRTPRVQRYLAMLRRSCAGRERGGTARTFAPSGRALPLRPLAALAAVGTFLVARSPPSLRTLGGEGGRIRSRPGHRDVLDPAASSALPCSCEGRSRGLLSHPSAQLPYPALRPSPEHGRYGADPLRKRRMAPGAPLVARADMWHASRGRAVTKGALTATSDPLRPHPAAAGAAKCRGDHRTAAFPASAVTWEDRRRARHTSFATQAQHDTRPEARIEPP